jgi:hypothetical protein
MKKHNQKGIATVEIVLFVIIFALIGFIGWYVMRQDKDNQALTDQTVSTSSNAPNAKNTSSNSKFEFKEFGVQINLPSELKGLTYKKDVDSSNNLILYMPEASKVYAKCNNEPAGTEVPFTSISKVDGKFNESTAQTGADLLKQFDDFYITSASVTSGLVCGSEELQKERAALPPYTDYLDSAFKTATKIQ